jgi:L,D-peptidoglycan transpeptidase YkuD (ErfK/YbiS/YcfS/YnhG family)
VKQSAHKGRLLWAVAETACAAVIALAFVSLQASQGAVIDGPADRIVVEKQAHTLTLFRQGKVLKIYRVALGRGGAGPKLQAGDNRVPEGVYRIVGRNPHSAFHRALKVGYQSALNNRQAAVSTLEEHSTAIHSSQPNGVCKLFAGI